jgi:hypothetical protein
MRISDCGMKKTRNLELVTCNLQLDTKCWIKQLRNADCGMKQMRNAECGLRNEKTK